MLFRQVVGFHSLNRYALIAKRQPRCRGHEAKPAWTGFKPAVLGAHADAISPGIARASNPSHDEVNLDLNEEQLRKGKLLE
jgi:hypothetical protein